MLSNINDAVWIKGKRSIIDDFFLISSSCYLNITFTYSTCQVEIMNR